MSIGKISRIFKKRPVNMKATENKSVDEENIALLYNSCAIDVDWYLNTYPDLGGERFDCVQHYYFNGAQEGRNPNFLFNTRYYLESNPDVAKSGMHPLVHFIRYGEREGRRPSVYFDPGFYHRQLPAGESPISLLGHYIKQGWKHYSPNEYFDTLFYIDRYQDIRDAQINPFHHYIQHGWKEHREIHTIYSFGKYASLLIQRLGKPIEPLSYFLQIGKSLGEELPLRLDPKKSVVGFQAALESGQEPNEYFEDSLIGDPTLVATTCARLFAFYLPQFYPFPENDRWWGPGFTEWRNVTKALPRFVGHKQPCLPRDLGFYDLRNVDTLREQVRIAKQSGIAGFCFYYYWFNGVRLLDKPLDLFIGTKEINFPFSLIWANENWTRRWDGLENDVLMRQDYLDDDDVHLIDDLARYFKHPNYERVNDRPLFMIYRPGIINNFKERLITWRKLFKERHDLVPLILMAQGFGDFDPTIYGLDGAIEFPPHKLAVDQPTINNELTVYDPNFSGHYMKYGDLISRSLEQETSSFELIHTLVPSWDNEARKPGRGMGFVGANPDAYEYWLRELIKQANLKPFYGTTPYVFVNAWNEWAEGAYLEPDLAHGCAYLNATFRALTGIQKATKPGKRILLVGHDGHRHGAQLLTLNIMRSMRNDFGMEVVLLLLEGGGLVQEYREFGKVYVLSDINQPLVKVVDILVAEVPTLAAITNTVVTGDVAAVLSARGFRVVSLIHELSALIKERKFEGRAAAIAKSAEQIVFADAFVQDSFEQIVEVEKAKAIVSPQGIYQSIKYDPVLRDVLRKRIGAEFTDRVVLNMGYGDLRKGFDLFVQLAKCVVDVRQDTHFVWLGNLHPDLEHWLESDIRNMAGRFHVLPFDSDVNTYLNGTDVFALTSREDPFPSVVLEALACGVPVVAFEGGGGYVTAINEIPHGGCVVPMANANAMAKAVIDLLDTFNSEKTLECSQKTSERYDWSEYVFGLLELAFPTLERISVVVPNYNYARYLPERLSSIFNQDYPIYEILYLDDCSTDASNDVISALSLSSRRTIKILKNDKNSGSVFRQWQKGVAFASGKYVWIAEADDSAKEEFVSDLLDLFDADTAFGFCDSAQVGSDGQLLGSSYQFYYQDIPVNRMASSFNIVGADLVNDALCIKNVILNVSSVLFKRASISDVFDSSLDGIVSYNVAGDWRIYCELLKPQGTKVVYCKKINNIHRRHDVSATHVLNMESHIDEISRVQDYARNNFMLSLDRSEQASIYLEDVRAELKKRAVVAL
ncbi:MAG: glycoside hydrolase family 99-like domain-containing protein [Azonexus sp.]